MSKATSSPLAGAQPDIAHHSKAEPAPQPDQNNTSSEDSYDKLNETTLQAIKEAEEMKRTHFAHAQAFSCVDEFMAYMLSPDSKDETA